MDMRGKGLNSEQGELNGSVAPRRYPTSVEGSLRLAAVPDFRAQTGPAELTQCGRLVLVQKSDGCAGVTAIFAGPTTHCSLELLCLTHWIDVWAEDGNYMSVCL